MGYTDVTVCVSVRNLDRFIAFNRPVRLGPGWDSDTAYVTELDMSASSVYVAVDSNGQVIGEPEIDDREWRFYSYGYSAQWGQRKSDPIMHPSEYVGGRLARDMVDDGGVYAVVEVEPLYLDGVPHNPGEFIGWVVVRLDTEN